MSDATDLYRAFAADGSLLYVGISFSALERLRQHRSDSAWFPTMHTLTIERFSSRQEALSAEAAAIKREKPLCNVVHNPLNRRTAPTRRPRVYREARRKPQPAPPPLEQKPVVLAPKTYGQWTYDDDMDCWEWTDLPEKPPFEQTKWIRADSRAAFAADRKKEKQEAPAKKRAEIFMALGLDEALFSKQELDEILGIK